MTNKNINKRLNQAGMASILVTMVLMIVISLIVLGFAQISRRNQRQALDNQLSNQAFYAAETGVNDYSKVIKAYLAGPSPVTASLTQTSCTPAAVSTYTGKIPSSVLSTTPDVSYTCVLVDATPTSLQYSSVSSTGPALIVPINASSVVNNLTVSWQTTQANLNNPVSGCPNAANIGHFLSSSGWAATNCGVGILRVDLVPVIGSFTIQSLQANTMTALLVPTSSGVSSPSTVSYSGTGNNQYGTSANQGAVVGAYCTNAAGCSVKITNLTGSNYYLRISSLYSTSSITVQGFNSAASTTALSLSGAQVMIDSTGKAQDILRRLQVRIPVNATASASTFDSAVQSSLSLCKQFQTYPGSATNTASGSGCALP